MLEIDFTAQNSLSPLYTVMQALAGVEPYRPYKPHEPYEAYKAYKVYRVNLEHDMNISTEQNL